MIFLEFMEKLHGLICVFFGIAENRVCLFVGFTEDAFFAFIQFFFFFLEGFLKFSYLFFIAGDLCALIFNGDTALLQRSQNILEGFILLTDLLFCLINDKIRKSQFGRNGESITFSRDTDEKAVGWT